MKPKALLSSLAVRMAGWPPLMLNNQKIKEEKSGGKPAFLTAGVLS